MAESLSHKFGQIIGDLLELAIIPNLEAFVVANNLYLDKKGKRLARTGLKVSWFDLSNNKHDLDYVIERNGTDSEIGNPVAFLEIAWRRYTKHSKNKAQEIQGAIMPLVERYKNFSPFKGVILAGVFSKASLEQLSTHGFNILYFPYDTVLKAFSKFGIDAHFDEKTDESEFRKKIDKWNLLPNKEDVAKELLALNAIEVTAFFKSMTNSVLRFVESVQILPLFGDVKNVSSVQSAIDFIRQFNQHGSESPFVKFEIIVKYNTGDKIEASFIHKQNAIDFLSHYI